MVTRVQEGKDFIEGNFGFERKDTEDICQHGKSEKAKPGRRQKERPPEFTDADQIKLTIDHFFGASFNQWLDAVNDPRNKEYCTYDVKHLLYCGILMFLLRMGSRRQFSLEKETATFLANLLSLSGTNEEFVADPDTLNYFLEKLSPEELEKIKIRMIKKLITDKRLDSFRVEGELLVAVDGTNLFSFDKPHCEQCLKTEHKNGTVTWNHEMLEAKIVAENGFALSIMSEPIENENEAYNKQDCELKAFYRLEKRLKQHFPRTKICLLLDGLYACQEVMSICKRNEWSFIVVFKEGRIPTLYAEMMRKKEEENPKKSLIVRSDNGNFQRLSWVDCLNYHGNWVHAAFCDEYSSSNSEEATSRWRWLTNIRLGRENIEEIVNKGGRQRWKIENQGFKEQKRHEFELEHLYGKKPNAWKNYYQLLQIAHIITQLIVYGDLCPKILAIVSGRDMRSVSSFMDYYQSVRNFVRRLTESFRNRPFSELAYSLAGAIQIRFSSA